MLLVNMMTVYVYQYGIGFQYSFGSAAFLTYLAVMNAADLEKRSTLRGALCAALCVAALCFAASTAQTDLNLISESVRNREKYAVMEAALAEIPEDASVVSSTSLLPHLANRDVIYEDYYHKPAEGERVDYVVIDLTHNHEKEQEKFEELGYRVVKEVKLGERTLIVILQ